MFALVWHLNWLRHTYIWLAQIKHYEPLSSNQELRCSCGLQGFLKELTKSLKFGGQRQKTKEGNCEARCTRISISKIAYKYVYEIRWPSVFGVFF